MKQKLSKSVLVTPIILLTYLLTHVYNLVILPVFADESIYIRWAQLIMDDWKRYLFFPLNDGKTPLFIWLLIPFQNIFRDQLFAARFVSVIVGFIQLLVLKELTKLLGGRQKAQWLAMVMATILPFWDLYHRMALMDSMLALFLTLVLWGILKLQQKFSLQWIIITGFFFGLAIWTKLPAIFFLPSSFVWPFLKNRKPSSHHFLALVGSACIGLALFAALRISPSFGQLFHRGADFTYPIPDVLFHGKWQETFINIPTYFTFFLAYLTPGVLLLCFAGLFSNRYRRPVGCLLLTAVIFAAPFVVFGKVVYPRYFLPTIPFFTLAAVLALQGITERWFSTTKSPQPILQKAAIGVLLALFAANTVIMSLFFMSAALTNPDQLPLVASDRSQYLEEWSSGHGILQTVLYIQQQAKTHTIAVATEGRFGTLPDGLLFYFHDRDVKNIYIEGTGEYPVKNLPDFFTQRAKNFDQSILVVNSHRMAMNLPQQNLIAQYCRPNNAPCLQIWNVTQLVKKSSP